MKWLIPEELFAEDGREYVKSSFEQMVLGKVAKLIPPDDRAILEGTKSDWRPPEEISFNTPDDDAIFEEVWQHLNFLFFNRLGGGKKEVDPSIITKAFESIALRHMNDAELATFSSSVYQYEHKYKALSLASDMRFQAALNNIPVVVSDNLDWKHVLEFRKDEQNVRKYRDLRIWLRTGLSAKSLPEAEDLIAQKIDDYKSAIEKWGFTKAIGTIKQVFDHRAAAGTAIPAVGTWVTTGGDVWTSLIAGGSALAAHVAINSAESLIKLDEAKGKHREVALLVDIEKKLTPSHGRLSRWLSRIRSFFAPSGPT